MFVNFLILEQPHKGIGEELYYREMLKKKKKLFIPFWKSFGRLVTFDRQIRLKMP